MSALQPDDLVVLEGCNAMLAVDSARACVAAAVAAVGQGPVILTRELNNALLALFDAGEQLNAFRDKALEAYVKQNQVPE